MKKGQGRPQKLGDQIQRELSDLLARELRDPRVGMVTLTSVDVSPDLSHAKVFFTIFEKDKLKDTLQGLKSSAGFLRSQLARRVKLGKAGVNIEYIYAGSAGSARKLNAYLGVSDIKAALKAAR